MGLGAVSEEPHHSYSSLRVRGRIFVTIPPGEEFIHVFVAEVDRELALAMHPGFLEKLYWGGKVLGLRVHLASADPAVVRSLVSKAYEARGRPEARPKSRTARARLPKP